MDSLYSSLQLCTYLKFSIVKSKGTMNTGFRRQGDRMGGNPKMNVNYCQGTGLVSSWALIAQLTKQLNFKKPWSNEEIIREAERKKHEVNFVHSS